MTRPTCARLGCEQPRGYGRKSFCGADCAAVLEAERKRRWQDEHRRASRPSRAVGADEVAVLRALRGERMSLNRAERRLAVADLSRQGLSTAQTADRLGLSARTVTRHRSALRQEHAA